MYMYIVHVAYQYAVLIMWIASSSAVVYACSDMLERAFNTIAPPFRYDIQERIGNRGVRCVSIVSYVYRTK